MSGSIPPIDPMPSTMPRYLREIERQIRELWRAIRNKDYLALSNDDPSPPEEFGDPGISDEAARSDHVHPVSDADAAFTPLTIYHYHEVLKAEGVAPASTYLMTYEPLPFWPHVVAGGVPQTPDTDYTIDGKVLTVETAMDLVTNEELWVRYDYLLPDDSSPGTGEVLYSSTIAGSVFARLQAGASGWYPGNVTPLTAGIPEDPLVLLAGYASSSTPPEEGSTNPNFIVRTSVDSAGIGYRSVAGLWNNQGLYSDFDWLGTNDPRLAGAILGDAQYVTSALSQADSATSRSTPSLSGNGNRIVHMVIHACASCSVTEPSGVGAALASTSDGGKFIAVYTEDHITGSIPSRTWSCSTAGIWAIWSFIVAGT